MKTRFIKYGFFLPLLIVVDISVFAQNETDNWHFGIRAALNFSTCTPTVITTSQINTIEGCVTISDKNGSLLFYTDGINVWNKVNTLMMNGTGLFGHPSSSQSGVIVPQPGNDSIYYVFTIDAEGGSRGLCYSIVNIKRNTGLGEVMVKNVTMLASANEKLTAVRHANKIDIWVLTRQFLSDKYYAWLITASGVSGSPVISTTPNFIGGPINYSRGYLKPSSDGKKLVSAFGVFPFLEMSDFNNQTGAISNTIKISSHPITVNRAGSASPYGVEFSPNNKLLYITTRFDFTQPCPACLDVNYYIHQYNVSVFDSAAISNSVVLIDSGGTVTHPGYEIYTALQLAKNGKIYIAQFDRNKLSTIENPNIAGTGCNFQRDVVDLGAGRCQGGFPTFIQSYFDPNYRAYDYNYSEDCNKNVSFTLNSSFVYDSLRWNFDDPSSGANNVSVIPNPIHSYSNNGLRNVQLYVFNRYGCINKIDTITKQIIVGNKYFNLGNDTSICERDSLLLNATVNGANSYLWNTGASTSAIKVSQPGIYWCDVSFGGCVYRDSLVLGNKSHPIINLGEDTTICETNTLLLNATNLNSTYLWQDGSLQPTFLVLQKGIYSVSVNMLGCVSKDTIAIDYQLRPGFTLGADKVICLGNKLILKPTIINGVSQQGLTYLWQDGSTASTFTATNEGIYRLDLGNICGFTTDEINVTKGVCELYVPSAFTPNGDAKNDVFKIGYGDNVIDFEIQIFNRYGQLVFNTKDKIKGWDGTVKGKMQQQGTYTWAIRYKTIVGSSWQEITGTVILLR